MTASAPVARHVAVQYSVLPSGCTIGEYEAQTFTVTVALRGADPDQRCWAVLKAGGRRLNRVTGKWSYEHIPSERRDEWIASHSFTLGEALTIAEQIADEYDENGMSWTTWCAFRDGTSEYRNDLTKRNFTRTETS